MYISPIWGAKTPGRIEPKFCLVVGVHDIIRPLKFGDDRFTGFWLAEGQSLHFPIYFEGRLTTLRLPCEVWYLAYDLSPNLYVPTYSYVLRSFCSLSLKTPILRIRTVRECTLDDECKQGAATFTLFKNLHPQSNGHSATWPYPPTASIASETRRWRMAEKCAAIASSIRTYFDLCGPQAILNYPFLNKWKSAFRPAVTVKTIQCWVTLNDDRAKVLCFGGS